MKKVCEKVQDDQMFQPAQVAQTKFDHFKKLNENTECKKQSLNKSHLVAVANLKGKRGHVLSAMCASQTE